MDCKKCGFQNPDNMRFCGQCAAPLNLACSSCGFENPFDFGFCGQCATSLSSSAVPAITPARPIDDKTDDKKTETFAVKTPPSTIIRPNADAAERRQLTVVFCDMVGSSALSERLDPEELRDIMSDYRHVCSEIVKRYDGNVAQYLGDGILIYFGFPHAHEDDASRAAHAALEIIQQVPQQRYAVQHGKDVQLAVRVGVHTGLVVVGEMVGDKRSMALGETPNIAARIQDFAEHNSVVISEDTLHLLHSRFECHPLGGHPLKGFSQPMKLFCVKQVRTQQNRFKGPRRQHQNEIVGREQEINLISERFKQARRGVSQIVLLNAEPGFGKTRMVQMLCEMSSAEQCTILECSGAPYYKNSFLFPVIDMLRRLLGVNSSHDVPTQLSRIEQNIATLGLDPRTVTPILAELLSIPHKAENSQQNEAVASTPQQKKSYILQTLLELLQTIAQQRFVLVVVEDLQWADPSTIELLTRFINQPGLKNIFAILTFRNEFVSPWQPRANLTQVTLNRLTQKQSGSMIRHLCGRKMLPLEVFNEIINKTDGVPFFVQELTNTVLSSSLLIEKNDHFELTSSMSQLGIPSTLQDSLMSRLDDLGADKELAQLSATLGREFSHELLSAASNLDQNQLQLGVNRLLNAELLFQRGRTPQAHYRFQHALLREAAYHSLLKRTRQKYHQRIATLIQKEFPQIGAHNPEILAHHCTEAGNYEQALQYWLTAGQYAIRRSANLEAVAHVNNGLAIFKRIPSNPQTTLLGLALQTTLGLATMMSKGYAAPEVEKAYACAHVMCEDIPDEKNRFPVLYGLWEFYIVRADMAKAQTLVNELQQLAGRSKTQHFLQEAQRALGTTQFWRGDLLSALENLQLTSDQQTKATNTPSHLVSYSQDTQVAAYANASCVLWLLGQPKQAIQHSKRALEIAKQLSHPFSQAYALNFLGTLSQLCGDLTLTYQYADAQIALSETYGFSLWAATGRMLKIWSMSANQTAEISCTAFQEALNDFEKSGNRLALSYFQSLQVGLYQNAGKQEEAKYTLKTALAHTHNGEGFFTAELLRLEGELALSGNTSNTEKAERHFQAAYEHAQQQGAKSLALRAVISHARLLNTAQNSGAINKQQQITLGKIKQQLKTLIKQLADGQETTDSTSAKQLLNSLNTPAASKKQVPSNV
jgi:predicted ATPase/class 3 adenylate cyclase